MRRAVALSLLAALAPWRPAVCQCPDGTPPPCGRGAASAGRAGAPDPDRIAILPFRVTATDTLLGEGLAELIAQEFTGTAGPRAVHMGSLLAAWHAAGGGPRSPLPLERAMRISAAVGAGRLVDGSIVGLGRRLTVAVSLVSVPGGGVVRLEPVSGDADSLEQLLRRVTVGLLTAAGGDSRRSDGRLTDSPRALRAYLEGMAAWRRRRYSEAYEALDRAIAADTLFAAAAFRRFLAGRYNYQQVERWRELAWRHQDRLAAQDRIVLRAILGERHPSPRTLDEQLADLEAAVRLAPESPEASYELGDILLHYGSGAGIEDAEPRAMRLLARSLAIDSQSTVLSHLVLGAANLGDTASLRSAWDAYRSFLGEDADWRLGWAVAAILSDRRLLAAARRNVTGAGIYTYISGFHGIPASLADEMYSRSVRSAASDTNTWLGYTFAAMMQGRPEAARTAAMGMPGGPGLVSRDALLVLGAVASDGDTAAASLAAARLARAGASDADRARAQCAVALWSLHRGSSAVWDDGLLRDNGQLNCAVMLDLMRAWRAGDPGLRDRLVRAERTVRERLDWHLYAGFENLVFAWIWESLGEPARALAAAGRVNTGFLMTFLAAVPSARLEGRLAGQLGDTARAVRAYRRYLTMRRDAEPVLIPQRDSVAAELASLERR